MLLLLLCLLGPTGRVEDLNFKHVCCPANLGRFPANMTVPEVVLGEAGFLYIVLIIY